MYLEAACDCQAASSVDLDIVCDYQAVLSVDLNALRDNCSFECRS